MEETDVMERSCAVARENDINILDKTMLIHLPCLHAGAPSVSSLPP
jgi:hypothetical protein